MSASSNQGKHGNSPDDDDTKSTNSDYYDKSSVNSELAASRVKSIRKSISGGLSFMFLSAKLAAKEVAADGVIFDINQIRKKLIAYKEDVEALQNPEQHVEGDLEDYVNDIDDFTYEHRKFNNNFLLPTLEAINQLIVKCEQLKDEFKLYKETKANRSVDHNIKIHNTLTSDVKTLNGDLRTVEKEMPNLQQRFIDLFPHESHTQHKKT